MIEERALVTSCKGDLAQIETLRTTACGHCQSSSACGTSLLSRFFGYRKISVSALNPIDARPGDEVVVGVRESLLMRASLLFYLLPILLLIFFAGLGQWITQHYSLVAAEPAAVVAGLLGLSIGLRVARRNALLMHNEKRNQAVILRQANPFKIEVRQ